MTSDVVRELLAEGRFDRVERNEQQASRMLRSCTQHLETADQRSAADP